MITGITRSTRENYENLENFSLPFIIIGHRLQLNRISTENTSKHQRTFIAAAFRGLCERVSAQNELNSSVCQSLERK